MWIAYKINITSDVTPEITDTQQYGVSVCGMPSQVTELYLQHYTGQMHHLH